MKTNNGFLITPSGLNVEKMHVKMVELNFEGVPLKEPTLQVSGAYTRNLQKEKRCWSCCSHSL
ncbi:MAG: hypothetical protein CM15mP58_11420 [Burkholderiaceae bacterium]|nr:MAG: hypothetical protein CM15mP58_11420 [Burkholderiaceae bacterium]